jgi:hypothetical protein
VRIALVAICVVAAVLAAAPARGQIPPLPIPIPTGTPTPNPTPRPRPTPTPTPSPAPAPPPTQYTLTLAVDKPDVLSGQQVVLSGSLQPPPANSQRVRIHYARGGELRARVAPDGSFSVTHKPRTNMTYVATVDVGRPEPITSGRVAVFADYVPRIYWRHRARGRVEAVMILSVSEHVRGDLRGDPVHFYGYRSRRSPVARRLFTARMFYYKRHATAYALRRVRGARRINYMFACLPERRPDNWGRPDDPVQTQCGRARLRLP